MALALILLVPGLATLWTAWGKFVDPAPPSPLALSLAGLGALAVNLGCAMLLARYRHHKAASPRRPSCRRATTRWPMSPSSRPDW